MLFEIKANNNPTRRRGFLFKNKDCKLIEVGGVLFDVVSLSHKDVTMFSSASTTEDTLRESTVTDTMDFCLNQKDWWRRTLAPSLNISHNITALVVLVQSSRHPNIGNSLIKTLYWPLRLNSFMVFMECWHPKWSIYRPFLYQHFKETNWTPENIGFFITYFEETITI